MHPYRYQGHSHLLREAGRILGIEPSTANKRAVPALSLMDTLAAQMCEPSLSAAQRLDIFEHIIKIRDSVALVHQAAEEILADLATGLDMPFPAAITVPVPPVPAEAATDAPTDDEPAEGDDEATPTRRQKKSR